MVESNASDDQKVFSFQIFRRLTSSISLALVCSILLKVVSPAFTMAVDRVWPETHSVCVLSNAKKLHVHSIVFKVCLVY